MTTRPAAVSGTFYPAEADALRNTVHRLLDDISLRSPAPKVLIAPHAGYLYSGPVAATGYAQLETAASGIQRVVLLGPAHRVYFRGLGLSTAESFSTPMGAVPVDADVTMELRAMPGVVDHDAAHAEEHSLEVHLPFLQLVLGDFTLVPVVVGDARHTDVTAVLDRCWGGAETLIVISTDLSHFLDYERARQLDAQTTQAIEAADGRLGPQQACGCRPLNAALELIRGRGMTIETLDVRNSGDTAGPRNRVVGYGTYVAT